MAEVTTEFQLLVFAMGLGIAVWSHIISSAEEKIDKIDKPYWKMAAANLQFFSLLILLYLFSSMSYALLSELQSGGLGSGGLALYLVLFALLLASVPTAAMVFLKTDEALTEIETVGERLVSIVLLILIVASVLLGFLLGSVPSGVTV